MGHDHYGRMTMSGRVYAINRRRGMAAIETNGYGFTIIELMGASDLELGDTMRWSDDTGLGSETYQNLTQGVSMADRPRSSAIAARRTC